MSNRAPLVVFSHLRWGFVYQRPQHVISRLAQSIPILFIEEPVRHDAATASWEIEQPVHNVTVCRLHTPETVPGFSDEQIEWLVPACKELIDEQFGDQKYNAWFYTPMAIPLLAQLSPHVVIYDCMDELSAFMNAPPALLERERELLGFADLVFTGGPSLFKSKRDRHPDVYCFSSSVDVAHFGQASTFDETSQPGDQIAIPHPRLGYCGVIDERIDLQLISNVAVNHPEWQIFMIGPVVKIDPQVLPRHANIHYLGSKPYGDLPKYLAGWDVCLMPFARNQSTRFISPTKTLEYMAAEKPIVSTSITDVAEPYGEIVSIADDPLAFGDACKNALHESNDEKQHRVQQMRAVLSNTSWDRTVCDMASLINSFKKNKPIPDDPSHDKVKAFADRDPGRRYWRRPHGAECGLPSGSRCTAY